MSYNSAAVIAIVTLAAPAWAQTLTPAEIEQHVRAGRTAWNSGDPARIAELDPQIGFGYRTRAPRTRVRFSLTVKKSGAGLRRIFYHRDAQEFDENSRYIPRPITSR